MGDESARLTIPQVFARRVKEARKRRGWTQRQLAERLAEVLGENVDRSTIAKIETGTRAASAPLQVVLALAVALDVMPVNLLVPLDDDGELVIARDLRLSPPEARAWFRGRLLLPGADIDAIFNQLPAQEQRALVEAHLVGDSDSITRNLGNLTPERISEAVEDIVWEMTEGDEIRRRESEGAQRARKEDKNDG